jgi:hypothetical protein
MRSSFASRSGFALIRTPSYRQQRARRRIAAVCFVLALALGSGVIGSLTTPRIDPHAQASTGPFSYFPSQ